MKFFRKKKIENNLESIIKKMSLEELIKTRELLENEISSHKDGYFYECVINEKIFKKDITNYDLVQNICNLHAKDRVEVFTNNMNIKTRPKIGSVYFFPSETDAELWRNHVINTKKVKEEFAIIKKWEDSTLLMHEKAFFPPNYTKEELLKVQRLLEDEKIKITFPVKIF